MNRAQAKEAIDQIMILLPKVQAWIDSYINANSHLAIPVADLNFQRLPKYFSTERLRNSKAVNVDNIQMPPLSLMGFTNFSDYENMKFIGITYKDTFFLAPEAHNCESTHFHEMVHIIQWDTLGPERFLFVYAIYLIYSDYNNSPLERMAYELQEMFNKGSHILELEKMIKKETLSISRALG